MHPSIFKSESRGSGERSGQIGNHNLLARRLRHDARRFMNSNAANIATHSLDFADMDPNANSEAVTLCHSTHRQCAGKRESRSFERRKETIAGCLYFAPTKAFKFASYAFEMSGQEPSPSRVTQPTSQLGRSYNVAEQYCGKCPTGSRLRREEGTWTCPLDLNTRFVANCVAVMPRWNLEHLIGADFCN